MIYPSAEAESVLPFRRTVRARVTAGVVAALAFALVPAAPASADPTPTPAPSSAVTPRTGATATSLQGLSAPVRDFSTAVRDFATTVESIDGSETQRVSKTQRTVILDSKVLFPEDSAKLSSSARRRLQSVADEIVDSKATGTVQVDGYTDDQGSAEYGLVLSRRRANAVRDVLAPLVGAQGVKIETRGRGEADPRFPNRDKAGRAIPKNQAKNRRVEITFAPR